MRDTSRIGVFDVSDMFPLISDDIVKGIIVFHSAKVYDFMSLKEKLLLEANLIVEECKKTLMMAATFAGVIRMKFSKVKGNEELRTKYMRN
jgi:hypothetical protein